MGADTVADAVLMVPRAEAILSRPVAWSDIADLVPIIRSQMGRAPYLQALMLRWLLEQGAGRGPITVPSVSEVSRQMDVGRQAAHRAWQALKRRGLIQVTPIEDDRGWSRVTVTLPENHQLAMFTATPRAK
jgi:hypothetical protein